MSRRKQRETGESLLQRLAQAVGLQAKPGTRRIVVSKGYCTPARPLVEKTLTGYGVGILEISETTRDLPIVGPIKQVAVVTVGSAQAAWAEYLLLRTGKLSLESQPQNRRNAEWAARHRGKMPPQWQIATGQWRDGKCAGGRA